MTAVTPTIIAMLMVSAAIQIFGFYLMPITQGFTQPVATVAMAVSFILGLGLMARILHAGVDLTLLVPIMSICIQLGAIAIAVFAYGEIASMAKIGTLVLACGLIGLSNML